MPSISDGSSEAVTVGPTTVVGTVAKVVGVVGIAAVLVAVEADVICERRVERLVDADTGEVERATVVEREFDRVVDVGRELGATDDVGSEVARLVVVVVGRELDDAFMTAPGCAAELEVVVEGDVLVDKAVDAVVATVAVVGTVAAVAVVAVVVNGGVEAWRATLVPWLDRADATRPNSKALAAAMLSAVITRLDRGRPRRRALPHTFSLSSAAMASAW